MKTDQPLYSTDPYTGEIGPPVFGKTAEEVERREALNQAAAYELGYRAAENAKNPYDADADDWAIAGAWQEGHEEAIHDAGVELAERREQIEDTPCLDPPWWSYP